MGIRAHNTHRWSCAVRSLFCGRGIRLLVRPSSARQHGYYPEAHPGQQFRRSPRLALRPLPWRCSPRSDSPARLTFANPPILHCGRHAPNKLHINMITKRLSSFYRSMVKRALEKLIWSLLYMFYCLLIYGSPNDKSQLASLSEWKIYFTIVKLLNSPALRAL